MRSPSAIFGIIGKTQTNFNLTGKFFTHRIDRIFFHQAIDHLQTLHQFFSCAGKLTVFLTAPLNTFCSRAPEATKAPHGKRPNSP